MMKKKNKIFAMIIKPLMNLKIFQIAMIKKNIKWKGFSDPVKSY